jgi:rare lipoprotein A
MNKAPRDRRMANAARRCIQLGAFALVGAVLASCAQPPVNHAYRNGKEYFSQAQYGRASPRVVGDGEAVPHGGGQYLVGHPYTIAGRTYYPSENESYTAVGMASWYGSAFQGRRTANGEIYDMASISAAHPTMPLPSYARVTNLGNGNSIIVRVNDRGPYHGGRVMDVSSRVADVLDFKGAGTAHVKVEYVGRASLEGSDDSKLLATLRTDGAPATLDGVTPVMVASNVLAPVEKLASAVVEAPAAIVAPAPAPVPPPRQPEPAPVALAEPTRPWPTHAPLPPARPFDLGTIPDAAVPIAAAQVAVLPPRRPPPQTLAAQNALYFAAPLTPPRKLIRGRGPFDQLSARAFTRTSEE